MLSGPELKFIPLPLGGYLAFPNRLNSRTPVSSHIVRSHINSLMSFQRKMEHRTTEKNAPYPQNKNSC